ncbi:MAG: Polysaccharide biosynthesis protein [Microgenomates group bacterium GW2011_GWB1_40_9]|nr:MAG: Polysaccharide biosynthesis protein [Microgenomates group bacterium GW2011_GWC1_39_12]KKR71233.1 MAG: Polysaccharide biosynthesis protein [Candidatus Levybacteria bacterium GW2011_GWC2_40_7]KKR79745.1 MAG: Polysaccharide biosynthesis protein [Microgenomates group bacterium GW2011_GWB1_40_9]
MDETNIDIIKKKSVTGIVALTSRTFLLQLIAFGATFLLTIYLTPAVFGIFFVVSAVISFLSYFSDIGLAAALIQKKEEITDDDLTTTFTIQQLLVFPIALISYLLSSKVAAFYGLDREGVVLFQALVVSFFFSSLKTIPSVLLERSLKFHILVIPQIAETLGFYIVAVVLASRGFGVASFTYAVLTRAIIGLVLMYIVSPWKIKIGIEKTVAKRLLKFGIPFQLNSFLALLKDDLMTVFLGKVLPFTQVGYIGWAKKWAEVPLRLIMDGVIRVTFPAFARLQHSKEILGHAIEKTLFGLAITILPISVGLMFFIDPVVKLIPKYSKWEPALFSFSLFVLSSILAAFSTPLTNALNAVGKIKITLMLMVFWTIATWVLTVTLVHFIGFNGVAVALLILTSSLGVVIALAKKIAVFSFVLMVKWPFVAACAQSLWYYVLRGNAPYAIAYQVLIASSGAILYIAVLLLFERKRIMEMVHLVRLK